MSIKFALVWLLVTGSVGWHVAPTVAPAKFETQADCQAAASAIKAAEGGMSSNYAICVSARVLTP